MCAAIAQRLRTVVYLMFYSSFARMGCFCMFSFPDIFAVLRILFYRKYLYNTYN